MEKRLDLYFEWDNDVMQLSDWLVPLFKNNGDVLAFRNVSIQPVGIYLLKVSNRNTGTSVLNMSKVNF